MAGLFGGKPKSKKSSPIVINKDQAQSDAESQRQADSEDERRRRAQLSSNLLFGAEGSSSDPVTKKKELLGE